MNLKQSLLVGVFVGAVVAIYDYVDEAAKAAGVSRREWLKGYARHLRETWG